MSNYSNPTLFLLANFLWKPKAPSKVMTFSWLVAHRKVNTKDMLQLRRPYKSLSTHWCILCKGNRESIDHLFLHCSWNLRLWNKLFSLTRMDGVLPRSIADIMIIYFRGLKNSIRGKTLWQIACLTLLWTVCLERNVRNFVEKMEIGRDVVGFVSLLLLCLGFLYYRF